MDEIDFTLNGKRYRLTRDMVTRALRKQTPGRIQTYSVEVEGVSFPVKQALAQALGIPVTEFISTRAQDLLAKLGFVVTNHESGVSAGAVLGVIDGRTRTVALELAVRYLSGRPHIDVAEVLEVGSIFAGWIGEGELSLIESRS